ncbi:hypothetical protein ACFONN_15125 [Dyella humi]|uniref:Uncharacterized protein n=1 Tax=Dyella humi TaxID=1770547 RepID=A0ABW8IM97_9GAMM
MAVPWLADHGSLAASISGIVSSPCLRVKLKDALEGIEESYRVELLYLIAERQFAAVRAAIGGNSDKPA